MQQLDLVSLGNAIDILMFNVGRNSAQPEASMYREKWLIIQIDV